jgi:hypothetical protein
MSANLLFPNSADGRAMHLSEDKVGKNLLRTSLFVCGAIIIANFAIGNYTPTTVSLNDEISFFDTLWRVVIGQRVGTDYHDPLGFGPYQVGALLWRWLGPHNYIMRLSIALFSISIALCGCLVARRTLAHRVDIALLFCITLAFQLSTPTVYPDSAQFGMMAFYNRLSASTLAVLFLHTFGDRSFTNVARDRCAIMSGVALSAFLLNVLFLTKISAFLLGIFIIIIGCTTQTRFVPKFVTLCATIGVFGAVTAIEFKVTGLDFIAVIREYAVAARARSHYSIHDVVQSLANGPFITSIALLLVFGLLQRPNPQGPTSGLRARGIIIGCYAGCQFALNMTNAGPPTMWLAPAAIVSLTTCIDMKETVWRTRQSENRSQSFDFYMLGDVSLREAAPFLVFALVLFRQILGSMLGVGVAVSMALGITAPYVITAGHAVSLWVYPGGAYEKSLNDAVKAIASLKLDQEVIANLDFSNTFSILFLAPPPKGNYTWYAWGYNIPYDAALNWYDVIGDACVVTIPAVSFYPGVTRRLVNVVQLKLATEFEVVYQDASWSIYQRSHDCGIELRP